MRERERKREREREKDSMSEGEAEREGDTESKAGPRLLAVSTEPNTGLELTNHENPYYYFLSRLHTQCGV